uniref:Uncharacterized protein n=1 Tax=Podarcis muralis TaxID=64176 RepID=A0A670J6J9_PODMU
MKIIQHFTCIFLLTNTFLSVVLTHVHVFANSFPSYGGFLHVIFTIYSFLCTLSPNKRIFASICWGTALQDSVNCPPPRSYNPHTKDSSQDSLEETMYFKWCGCGLNDHRPQKHLLGASGHPGALGRSWCDAHKHCLGDSERHFSHRQKEQEQAADTKCNRLPLWLGSSQPGTLV